MNTTKRVLRILGRRYRALDEEVCELQGELDELIALAAPRLMAQHSVGPQTAAKLLCMAGDNPRVRNQAAFAALCRTFPDVPGHGGEQQRLVEATRIFHELASDGSRAGVAT